MSQTKMTMSELHELHRKGLAAGDLILDVRDEDEFAEGHVAGARNIPQDRVLQHAGELKGFRRVFVHCGGGGRAGRAAEALAGAGVTGVVHISDSGMRSWVAAGYPVEK